MNRESFTPNRSRRAKLSTGIDEDSTTPSHVAAM